MIVYQSSKAGFCKDVASGGIDDILSRAIRTKLGRRTGASEVRSWRESLAQMHLVLAESDVPDDSGVGIEYQIPLTAKRIDVLVSGSDATARERLIIVELKQWERAEPTPMDGVVRTVLGGAIVETTHPSYQAASYADLLRGFNEIVYEDDIALHPCAFLHNYRKPGGLDADTYEEWLEQAPLFGKGENLALRAFIEQRIQCGDGGDIIRRIERSKSRPSKTLAESLGSMLEGSREFTMIDAEGSVRTCAPSRA